MKCKKILSFLLAAVMVLGILPMTALAAETAIGATANGEFADTAADPGETYEYTVTGSDGSEESVAVPAANTETGNGIVEQSGSTVYYEKISKPANANGECLLVDADSGLAVTTAPGAVPVVIEGNRINEAHPDAEWTVTKPERNKLNFASNGQALTVQQTRHGSGSRRDPYTYSYGIVMGRKGDNQQIRVSGETVKLSRTYYEPTRSYHTAEDYPVDVYIRVSGSSLAAVKEQKQATAFTLFGKKTQSVEAGFAVDTAGLDALLNQEYNQNNYTDASWNDYADARAEAEQARAALEKAYTDRGDAEAALAEIDNVTRSLEAAIKGLQKQADKPVAPGTCVKPEITWHRTWESGHRNERPVQNVQHLIDRDPWLNITWDWNQVRKLQASDPNPWNANNGTAATWSKGYTGSWTDSSVRRFTGTFIWPEGVGLDGEVTLQSVNDASYQFIYDYIDRTPSLEARYGGAKVLPINDDMYVFISKASDGEPSGWNVDEARDHLAFWTGTTGKGIWSQNGNTGNDWGRREPAHFEGVNATPAYHGSWPNLVDTTGRGSNSSVQNWDLHGQPNPMAHTDSWYTLTDTNALKSQLNELYGAAADLGGEEMRIDIYSFDNSASGGMDELELILCAAEQTTAQVQVNYWLDSVGAVSLGSSVMTREIGDTVNLPEGTNTNELNHKKSEAVRIAGENADVSNGTQVEKDYVVKTEGNVLNVVYTRKVHNTKYYTYDFGVTNRYLYQDENTSAIMGVSVECATDSIDASFSGHEITLTYTPRDALGSFVQATLVVERRNSTNRYEIGFIPASNVLYEENFIRHAPMNDRVHWAQLNSNMVEFVNDNDDNIYGYTAAYEDINDSNGIYSAQVSESNRYTDELKFSFRGLGLDLIGSCGPNYGTLAVKIMQGTQFVKSYVIDTSFSGGVIDQVPLLHAQDGLEAGKQYDVTISGAYLPKAAAAAVMSADGTTASIDPAMYDFLTETGLTDEQIMDTEFIAMEETLSKQEASTFSAGPGLRIAQTVTVDGFRVYRSTEKANAAYAENEQNLIYTNVMDDAIIGDFMAYVEHTGDGRYTAANYEKAGGPENELYLTPGNGVSFQLDTAYLAGGKAPYAQVSLRAVSGNVLANKRYNIVSNTEMYYVVEVDSNGLLTVTNTSSENDPVLLAIGNLKTNCPLVSFVPETKQLAVEAVAAFFAMPPQEEVFAPAALQGKIVTSGIGCTRLNTLTVTASSDVDVLTVDGETVRPMNKVLVDLGLADQYVYKAFKRTKRSEAVSFEVVAYDADGVASDPMTIQK